MANEKVPRIAFRHEILLLAKQRQRREDRVADKITVFSGDAGRVYATAQERIEKAKAQQAENRECPGRQPGLVAGRTCPRPPVLVAWGTSGPAMRALQGQQPSYGDQLNSPPRARALANTWFCSATLA
jgi:hypothetical protein